MFLEPPKQTAPAVFRRLLTIARPIVRIAGVRRIWVYDNRRRTVGSAQGLLHLFHGLQRSPLVASAEQTENRSLQSRCHVQRMRGLQFVRLTDESSVPRDAGLHLSTVRSIQPDNPSTPTESGDPELLDISIPRSLDPSHGCIQIC